MTHHSTVALPRNSDMSQYDTATILIALFLIVNFILMICIYE
jgi:hypothetical protein